jgi:hypothetical protein
LIPLVATMPGSTSIGVLVAAGGKVRGRQP